MDNAISWFEIPATDLERAAKFYENIFSMELIPLDMGEDMKMRMFPVSNSEFVGGAIVYSPDLLKPSATDGVMIYLNANPDLAVILSKVEAAGGQVAMPKTVITDEFGFMAILIDTEGNRIGLHSMG